MSSISKYFAYSYSIFLLIYIFDFIFFCDYLSEDPVMAVWTWDLLDPKNDVCVSLNLAVGKITDEADMMPTFYRSCSKISYPLNLTSLAKLKNKLLLD